MGDYEDALAIARRPDGAELLDVEKPGGTKYGFGLNFEQPLADDGETGLFGRIGWNDGTTRPGPIRNATGMRASAAAKRHPLGQR